MMDFKVFHRYRRLARRGIVEPLCCPDCQAEFVLRITEDDEPALQCFACATVVHPGGRLYNDIEAVVKEHF